jgi:hypothetical protein
MRRTSSGPGALRVVVGAESAVVCDRSEGRNNSHAVRPPSAVRITAASARMRCARRVGAAGCRVRSSHNRLPADNAVVGPSGCAGSSAKCDADRRAPGKPIAAAGAAPGELELNLAAGVALNIGDVLYARQLIGGVQSAQSRRVRVTDCRNVVTQHNNNSRTGAYLHETVLTPAAVRTGGTFGRLYERHVDGSPFAQILYVRNVPIGRKARNVFFVATSANMVYAFDADDHNPARTPRRSGRGPWELPAHSMRTKSAAKHGGPSESPAPRSLMSRRKPLYVVGRTWDGERRSPVGTSRLGGDNYLHALNLTDGTDRYPPRKIEGTDPRTGNTFDPTCQRNRPGLLLLNGVIYIGFATFSCDGGPYHGWIFGYNVDQLQPEAIFCTSKDLHGAGVWQSGNGLVGADDGSVYFETGNPMGEIGTADSVPLLAETNAGTQEQ